jgi:methylisocitrate lyase
MVQKVSIASQNRLGDDFILIARTDAFGVDGMDAAIERGCAYREAGADMIFPEGLQSEEAFETFAKGCDGLLLANMTEFGKTPHIPAEKFGSMGYDLVIYPVTMQRVAMDAVTRCLSQLHRDGTAEGFEDKMQTRQDLYDLLGYEPDKP